MCIKKPKIPDTKVTPPPTQVQPADVETDNGERKERRKKGYGSTELRDTILGTASEQGRNTLG